MNEDRRFWDRVYADRDLDRRIADRRREERREEWRREDQRREAQRKQEREFLEYKDKLKEEWVEFFKWSEEARTGAIDEIVFMKLPEHELVNRLEQVDLGNEDATERLQSILRDFKRYIDTLMTTENWELDRRYRVSSRNIVVSQIEMMIQYQRIYKPSV